MPEPVCRFEEELRLSVGRRRVCSACGRTPSEVAAGGLGLALSASCLSAASAELARLARLERGGFDRLEREGSDR